MSTTLELALQARNPFSMSASAASGSMHSIAHHQYNDRATSERQRVMPWISEYEISKHIPEDVRARLMAEDKEDKKPSMRRKLKALFGGGKKARTDGTFSESHDEDNIDWSKLPKAEAAPDMGKRPRSSLNPVLRELLNGLYDDGSPLSILRGVDLVLSIIFKYIRQDWAQAIETDGVFVSKAGTVEFPEPTGININMMPIVIGVKASLPEEIQQYFPVITSMPIARREWGEVGYLTIHESIAEEHGQSQRRSGLHVETPATRKRAGIDADVPISDLVTDKDHLGSNDPAQACFGPTAYSGCLTLAWGRGYYDGSGTCGHYQGGIFMASTVDDSCRVWNAKVAASEAIGSLGDVEHLRGCLDDGHLLKAGDLIWMTDCTPHESLPLKKGGVRQYVRLVTSAISVWYSQHSTPNPVGITPPPNVVIWDHDKFASAKQAKHAP